MKIAAAIVVSLVVVVGAATAAPALVNEPHDFEIEPYPDTARDHYRFRVGRLYVAYFGRLPDKAGWRTWNTRFVLTGAGEASGLGFYPKGYVAPNWSMANISDQFAKSPEFVNRYGALGNRQFAELVYQNVLARKPDAAGLNAWTDRLNRQVVTRGELMLKFSESPEFVDGRGLKVLLNDPEQWAFHQEFDGDIDTTYYLVDSVGTNCDPNYFGCMVPRALDVDCRGGGGNGPVYVTGPFPVDGEDIYGLDNDRNGIACG